MGGPAPRDERDASESDLPSDALPPFADTPGPISPQSRIKILAPLKLRDFSFLWWGMSISLIGDGIYVVAIAWQVLRISNSASALSAVFTVWMVPQVILLLFAGVVTDRFDRRRVLIASDVVRFVAIAAMGVLSVTGALELWHLYVLVAIYGIGESFFMPAFSAIVPDVVPERLLVEANSLEEFARPFAMRLLGPAIGGFLIEAASALEPVARPGVAFLADAGTFVVSTVCVFLMRPRPIQRQEGVPVRTIRADLAEGFRFVRSRTWLWAGLGATAVGLLAFYGPWMVLVPFVVRNELGGGAGGFGAVLAAGGVGAIGASLLLGQKGLPGRPIAMTMATWAASILLLGGFALANALWQAMVVSFGLVALFTGGQIVWSTLLQKHVPGPLLGRVAGLDWLVSTALLPLSLAAVGPLAEVVGASATLIAAGAGGAVLMLSVLLVPGVERLDHPAGSSQREAATTTSSSDR